MSSFRFNGCQTAKIFANVGELEGKHASIYRQRGCVCCRGAAINIAVVLFDTGAKCLIYLFFLFCLEPMVEAGDRSPQRYKS